MTEQENYILLGNSSINIYPRQHIHRQQSKNCSKRCFLFSAYRRYMMRKAEEYPLLPRVEAGSNTSTVALRVVGGDEKGTRAWGYNWATMFLGDFIRGPDPPGWGSLEFETVKHGHESRGTRAWEWLRGRGPAGIVNDIPTLSSERLLRMDYNRKCSVEKKVKTGCGSQGAWRQDELIGCKPAVLK
jgi:hypothetical protein